MGPSIYLAKLIGPIFVVGGLGLFLQRDTYRAMAREFLASPALVYLSGLLAMSAGLAIVLAHNVWAADWRVIITLLGWAATLGGAVRILMPAQVRRVGERMLASRAAMTGGGVAWLAAGIVLCFFGYLR